MTSLEKDDDDGLPSSSFPDDHDTQPHRIGASTSKYTFFIFRFSVFDFLSLPQLYLTATTL